MCIRDSARVIVERAYRDDRESAALIDSRHARAAHAAEHMGEELGLGQLVRGQEIFAANEAQPRQLDKQVRRVARAANLAAPRAVTVIDANRRAGHLERDTVAQTASLD